MSQRDQELVKLSSLRLTEIAPLLGKTPQTIRRGVNAEPATPDDDYFSPADVYAIVQRMKKDNPEHAELAKQRLRALYPTHTGIEQILADVGPSQVAETPTVTGISGGEFKVFVQDFKVFAVAYKAAAEEIVQLAKTGHAFITFCIRRDDTDRCANFMRQHKLTGAKANMAEFFKEGEARVITHVIYRPERGNARNFLPHAGGLIEFEGDEATDIIDDFQFRSREIPGAKPS